MRECLFVRAMKRYLFVGGIRDGDRIEVPITDIVHGTQWRVEEMRPGPVSMPVSNDAPLSETVTSEVYQAHKFSSGPHTHWWLFCPD